MKRPDSVILSGPDAAVPLKTDPFDNYKCAWWNNFVFKVLLCHTIFTFRPRCYKKWFTSKSFLFNNKEVFVLVLALHTLPSFFGKVIQDWPVAVVPKKTESPFKCLPSFELRKKQLSGIFNLKLSWIQ